MSTARILVGDALEQLRTLPDESVQCCVTSPPYWGLRDYGEDDQLGLEPTPDEYVANMVEVFREVRRVLRIDGVLWLNLGDSYAANRSHQVSDGKHLSHDFGGSNAAKVPDGLKPKDLCGIPWRVAFALQADGWWLRSDIVWSKPNPMPESVTDRPTKAHEYVFLLSKSERYFYDADAIAEAAIHEGRVVKASDPDEAKNAQKGEFGRTAIGFTEHDTEVGFTRNARSVWTITTKPFPGAHFAVFPPEMAEKCILAGTSQEGACPECGAPWERDVEKGDLVSSYPGLPPASQDTMKTDGDFTRPRSREGEGRTAMPRRQRSMKGWQPTCDCDTDDVMSCTVLDPFAGSGTVGMVATGHGRDAILIDLNPDYAEMMKNRIGPMFVEDAA